MISGAVVKNNFPKCPLCLKMVWVRPQDTTMEHSYWWCRNCKQSFKTNHKNEYQD